MKKILITGTNSYIGTSFEKWLLQFPDKYSIDKVSLRNENWKEQSFAGYDVVFHTAAVVHVLENDDAKYFEINKDLAVNVAKKAEKDGVKQFIFLSTMGVYGAETGHITKDSVPKPKTLYAQSKYEAEQLLTGLIKENFDVVILRPPIVYGKGCPGNYSRLGSMALKLPFIPDIENNRSMIFIDNLSEFVRLIIDYGVSGLYFPQNKEYVKTTNLVDLIAKAHGEKTKKTKVFNWSVSIALLLSKTIRKVFGSFVYDKEMPGAPGTLINGKRMEYETVSFEKSILYTEGRENS